VAEAPERPAAQRLARAARELAAVAPVRRAADWLDEDVLARSSSLPSVPLLVASPRLASARHPARPPRDAEGDSHPIPVPGVRPDLCRLARDALSSDASLEVRKRKKVIFRL
jgi:hypothetical protein